MKNTFKHYIFLGIIFLSFITLFYCEEALGAAQGKVVISLSGDPTTLDPHMHSESNAFAIIRNMYDHLISRGFDQNGKLEHFPMLATSWKATSDTSVIFNLRKGVKFHNGEEFNAEAVKYSIERMIDPAQKARYRGSFTQISRVEIIDQYTIRIVTKTPMPTLIINLGYNMSMLPPKYFKEKGDKHIASHPIGTGPYKFVRWVKDDELVMEANDNYWAGPPKIKTLVFKPIPEDSTRVAALISGDVDIAKNIPVHLIPMVNNSGIAKVVTQASALSINSSLNTLREGPLQDKRVRQAINYAVDKESIVKNILQGYGSAQGQLLTPSHFGYDPTIKPYPYNPEKAKALLKEAGYGGGINLTLFSPSTRYVKVKEFSETIVDQLAKVGINIKLELTEWGNFQSQTNNVTYPPAKQRHMVTRGWAGSFDADELFEPILGCKGSRSIWCNKQFDSIIDQARSTMNQKKREELYHQAGKLVHEEAPVLFLFYGVDTYGHSNRVQNWKPSPYEGLSMYMYDVSMDSNKSPWVKK
jgi:peptide/nickel transport system substrate-binding protein